MKYIANPVEVDAEIIVSVGVIEKDASIRLKLESGKEVVADHTMLARYIPTKGDYLVTQADGYVYINPKEIFERKYHAAVWDALNCGCNFPA